MSNPREEHWTALKRVLRYLQGTRELGICYSKTEGQLTLSAWTDASWGEAPDDSRSTNSYVILMQREPIAWKSQKQQSVALSSTETEYVGQTMAATTVMWSRNLLHELQISGNFFSQWIRFQCPLVRHAHAKCLLNLCDFQLQARTTEMTWTCDLYHLGWKNKNHKNRAKSGVCILGWSKCL